MPDAERPKILTLEAIVDKLIDDAGLDENASQQVKRSAENADIPALSLAELLDLQNDVNLTMYACLADLIVDNRKGAFEQFDKLGDLIIRANRASGMVTVRVVATLSDLAKRASQGGES